MELGKLYPQGKGAFVPETKLYSRFDGDDAETDYLAETGQELTFVGTAQLDTAQKKYGVSSLLLDGNSDYVTVPDSPDWDFGSEDFTMDLFVRFGATGAYQTIIGQGTNSTNVLEFGITNTNQVRFIATNGVSSWAANYTSTNASLSVGNWYHIAAVRNGSSFKIYVNGVALSLTESVAISTIPNYTSALTIGCYTDGSAYGNYVNGHIDGFRVTKGTALWTSNFTPPKQQYTVSNLRYDTWEKIFEYTVGDGIAGTNVLTGGTASASHAGNGAASNAVDGNAGTHWATSGVSLPQWWKYDLGSGVTKTVKRLKINPWNNPGVRMKDFKLEGSNDNSSWDVISTFQIANSTNEQTFECENDTAYRYYRIYITSQYEGIDTGMDEISMFEVFGNTAISALDITDLAGDTDEIYMLDCRVVNGYNGAANYQVYLNGDKASNYGYQQLIGTNSTIQAMRGTFAGLFCASCSAQNYIANISIVLHAKSGKVRVALINSTRSITGTTIDQHSLLGESWNNSTDEVNSVSIATNKLDGLGIGTYISLYRRISS